MSKKVDQSEKSNTKKNTARKKKDKGIIGLRFIMIMLSISFLFAGMSFGYYFGYKIFNDTERNGSGIEAEITIEEGESVNEVAVKLYDAGLIDARMVFIFQAYFYSYEIVPGTYYLNDSMTNKEIFIHLEGGGL